MVRRMLCVRLTCHLDACYGGVAVAAAAVAAGDAAVVDTAAPGGSAAAAAAAAGVDAESDAALVCAAPGGPNDAAAAPGGTGAGAVGPGIVGGGAESVAGIAFGVGQVDGVEEAALAGLVDKGAAAVGQVEGLVGVSCGQQH